jgi:hypothetical protein
LWLKLVDIAVSLEKSVLICAPFLCRRQGKGYSKSHLKTWYYLRFSLCHLAGEKEEVSTILRHDQKLGMF